MAGRKDQNPEFVCRGHSVNFGLQGLFSELGYFLKLPVGGNEKAPTEAGADQLI